MWARFAVVFAAVAAAAARKPVTFTPPHDGYFVPLDGPAAITVDWSNVTFVSKTQTTLQVVANPVLARSVPVSSKLFETLSEIRTDFIRYVPWFPYPFYGVAELNPPNYPNAGDSSYNFTLLDEMLSDFMAATYDKSNGVIINFSTQPTWLYNTTTWDYPADPFAADWGYPRGNGLKDPTGKELGAYYGRLLSWMTNGWFVDEFGKNHTGGHTYNIPWWEVYNEPEGCHGMDPMEYTRQFDAVVTGMRAQGSDWVSSGKMKFMGLALEGASNFAWYSTFLNASNHVSLPSPPLDAVSFHFYAGPSSRTDPNAFQEMFPAADGFFGTFAQIKAIRDQLSPHTLLDCDEMGSILPNDNDPSPPPIHPLYWPASGGLFAYEFGHLAAMGLDIMGISQFSGCPVLPEWGINDAQYPSVSLTNWTTGAGNARFWVLRMLLDNFQSGDDLVSTSITGTQLFAQAFKAADGTQRILVVNKLNAAASFTLPAASGTGTMYVVDATTQDSPPSKTKVKSGISIPLNPFATAVVVLDA